MKPFFQKGYTLKLKMIHKKPFQILAAEFNPIGAPGSNDSYYTPSFDKCRRLKESYLKELQFGRQTEMLF